MYMYPFNKGGYDAQVSMWVRADMLETGLDEHLFHAVKTWITEDWPFEKVAYPGRDMSFDEFNRLRNQ